MHILKQGLVALFIIIACCVSLPSEASSDEGAIQFKFGGWSNHIGAPIQYNESHNGFGIAYEGNEPTWGFDGLSFELFTMKDSQYQTQTQVSVTGYNKLLIEWPGLHAIDLNLSAGVMDRTINWERYSYKTKRFEGVETGTFPYLLPSVTYHITESIHIDITYLPKGIVNYHTVFARFGYTFK